MDQAVAIRKQLRLHPTRKIFRKSRSVLLDIAIELEVLRKVVADLDPARAHAMAMVGLKAEGV